jgi:hypothetical protein
LSDARKRSVDMSPTRPAGAHVPVRKRFDLALVAPPPRQGDRYAGFLADKVFQQRRLEIKASVLADAGEPDAMRYASAPALACGALGQVNDEIHRFRQRVSSGYAPCQFAAAPSLQTVDNAMLERVRLYALGEHSETTEFNDQTARVSLDIRQT